MTLGSPSSILWPTHWTQKQPEASFFWGAEQRRSLCAKFLVTNIAAKCWQLLSSESYSPKSSGSDTPYSTSASTCSRWAHPTLRDPGSSNCTCLFGPLYMLPAGPSHAARSQVKAIARPLYLLRAHPGSSNCTCLFGPLYLFPAGQPKTPHMQGQGRPWGRCL